MGLLTSSDLSIILGSFTLGIVSSLHCMGMCGPIITSFRLKKEKLLYYHVGKLLSYLVLALTLHFTTFSILLKFKEELKIYAFIFLIIFYLFIFFFPRNSKGKLYSRFFQKIIPVKNEGMKAFLIGILSGLLPCAILYTFLLSVAMVFKVEVLILSVLAFSFATYLGLTVFQLALGEFLKRVRVKEKYIQIFLALFALLIIFHRYFNFDLYGFCSNIIF